jgi:hypothetical protein
MAIPIQPVWRFYLNGTLLRAEPLGWSDQALKLSLDKQTKGYWESLPNEITFIKDGYEALYRLYSSNGYNMYVPFLVKELKGTVETVYFRGLILLSDLKWDLEKRTVTVEIEDDTITGRIRTHLDTKFNINAGLSLSGVDISSYQAPVDLKIFTATTGTYNSTDLRSCVSVYNACAYLIAAITDGEARFVSDTLLAAEDEPELLLLTGYELRKFDAQRYPEISLKQVLEFLISVENVYFSAENRGGVSYIRIERESYYLQAGVSVTLPMIKAPKVRTDTDRLYSQFNVGCNEHIDNPEGTLTGGMFDVRWINHRKEEYSIVNKAGNNTALDLTYDFISDHNIIISLLPTTGDPTDDSRDNDVFVIYATPAAYGYEAVKTILYEPNPPYIYNHYLLNSEIAQRWLGGVPENVAMYLGNESDEFEAFKAVDTPQTAGTVAVFIVPADFATETIASASYDNTTYIYTAPSTGVYSFQTNAEIKNVVPSGFGVVMSFVVEIKVKSGITVLHTFSQTALVAAGQNIFLNTGSVYLNIGYTVEVNWHFSTVSGTVNFMIGTNSYFKCPNSSTGGGVYETYNPTDYPVELFEFEYPLKASDFRKIRREPFKKIGFTYMSGRVTKTIYGYLQDIERNLKTGMTKFLLRRTKTLNRDNF